MDSGTRPQKLLRRVIEAVTKGENFETTSDLTLPLGPVTWDYESPIAPTAVSELERQVHAVGGVPIGREIRAVGEVHRRKYLSHWGF